MENVEVKTEEVVAKPAKKVAKKVKKDAGKAAFMKDRNLKRTKAGLKEAYTKEEIAALK